MAERKLVVSGINVVTHPHSAQGYVDLFRAAFNARRPVQIRGTQHLMLGELRSIRRDDPTAGLFGRVYRFDHIDPDLPWFNLARHDAATEEELAEINIPDDLKPNLVMFDFVFYPRGHSLYFVSRYRNETLSARSFKTLLDGLFGIEKILNRFGLVELTIMPDRQQLDRIFRMARLAKLTIDVKRPNPDDNEADEELVFGRLDRQGARRIVQVLVAEPHESITPDDDTQTLARVAEHNGKVEAIGYDEVGHRLEESTVDKPWREPVVYDTDFQTAEDAFLEFTTPLANR